MLKLKHCSNGELGPACKALVQIKREDVKEDEEVEVSIEGLKVPEGSGLTEIVEFWRFVDEKGVEYGQPLRIRSVSLTTFLHATDADHTGSALTARKCR